MTLSERADEIMNGITASSAFPEGDRTFVREKLAGLLREAMGEVCTFCKHGSPVEQIGPNAFVHKLGDRNSFCMASQIRPMLKD